MLDINFLIQKSFYKRHIVSKDRNRLYLFSDNLQRTSGGCLIDIKTTNPDVNQMYLNKKYPYITQACVRGLVNCLPITTRESVSQDFTDYSKFYSVIVEDCRRIIDNSRTTIIVPSKGFGTGKAGLTEEMAVGLKQILKDLLGLETCIVENFQREGSYYGVAPDIRVYKSYSTLPRYHRTDTNE